MCASESRVSLIKTSFYFFDSASRRANLFFLLSSLDVGVTGKPLARQKVVDNPVFRVVSSHHAHDVIADGRSRVNLPVKHRFLRKTQYFSRKEDDRYLARSRLAAAAATSAFRLMLLVLVHQPLVEYDGDGKGVWIDQHEVVEVHYRIQPVQVEGLFGGAGHRFAHYEVQVPSSERLNVVGQVLEYLVAEAYLMQPGALRVSAANARYVVVHRPVHAASLLTLDHLYLLADAVAEYLQRFVYFDELAVVGHYGEPQAGTLSNLTRGNRPVYRNIFQIYHQVVIGFSMGWINFSDAMLLTIYLNCSMI